jgi:hypothetical protein
MELSSNECDDVIVTGGWSRWVLFNQLLYGCLAIAIVARVLTWTVPDDLSWERPIFLVGGMTFILGIDLAVMNKTAVWRVELSSGGVRFVFPFHSEAVRWTELMPSPSPPRSGFWRVYRQWIDAGGTTRIRAYGLSLPQARAVLAHPSRPKWTVSPGLLESIGVA